MGHTAMWNTDMHEMTRPGTHPPSFLRRMPSRLTLGVVEQGLVRPKWDPVYTEQGKIVAASRQEALNPKLTPEPNPHPDFNIRITTVQCPLAGSHTATKTRRDELLPPKHPLCPAHTGSGA